MRPTKSRRWRMPPAACERIEFQRTGIWSFCPITTVSLVRPFAFFNDSTLTPYFLPMAQSESPLPTVWIVPDNAALGVSVDGVAAGALAPGLCGVGFGAPGATPG